MAWYWWLLIYLGIGICYAIYVELDHYKDQKRQGALIKFNFRDDILPMIFQSLAWLPLVIVIFFLLLLYLDGLRRRKRKHLSTPPSIPPEQIPDPNTAVDISLRFSDKD